MNMKFMDGDIREISKSRTFRGILLGIVIAVIALLIFQVGVFVGETKATFSYGLGDNYYRAFEGRGVGSDTPPTGGHLDGTMPGAFGATGKVVAVDLPNIVIASSDDVEKTVTVATDTIVRQYQNTVTSNDITVDEYVVVIGEPEQDGDIDAKLIRIVPPPPTDGSASGTTTSTANSGIPAIPQQGPAY